MGAVKKRRKKKKEEKGKRGFLWLGVCCEQSLLLFWAEKLETQELLILCCKAGNAEVGNGAYQPNV